MKTLITIILILFCLDVQASTYYLRVDGGDRSECLGTYDAPKNLSRKCAWSVNVLSVIPQSKGTDTFVFSQKALGEFIFTFQAKQEYTKKTDFSVYKNHISFYTDQMDLGKTFFFRRYVKGKGIGIYKVQYVGKE